MANGMDPTALLSFINQRKATQAVEQVRNQFSRGITVDVPGGDNSPLYQDYNVEVPASATSEEINIVDIASEALDGILVKRVEVTTNTNSSVESVIIDEVEIPLVVASGSATDFLDVKEIFGDYVYAETKISVKCSNSVATAENISAIVIGFKDE